MLQLDYSSGKHTGKMVVPDYVTVKVDGLNPGTEYKFSVRRIADDGRQSNASSQCVCTGNYEMQPHNFYNVFLYCIMFCLYKWMFHFQWQRWWLVMLQIKCIIFELLYDFNINIFVKSLHYPHRAQPSCAPFSLSDWPGFTVSLLGPPCWRNGEIHGDLLQRQRNCKSDDNDQQWHYSQRTGARGVLHSGSFHANRERKNEQTDCGICSHQWVK